MIEAPCSACGTLNRIAEADVPAGAKFVTCSSCKSRVAMPATKTVAGAPAIPKLPAVPKTPPPIPKPGAPPAIDLADLPAPKRSSALAGAGDAKPAPKSALSSLDADLPAPKVRSAGLADLPAPKAKMPTVIPPAKPDSSTKVGLADMPARKPASPRPPDALDEGIVDLPAPKVPAGIVDLPTPKVPAGIVDLPTPKVPAGIVDLPAPKVSRASATPPAGVPTERLELPKPPAGIVDLPPPKQAGIDLPAPKGFFDDLPVPAKPATDVAPKGFFDDLPVPAKPATDVAPKGFFDDLPVPAKPGSPPGVPAPQGFFDDLPVPTKPALADVPAPKGFFDDLPVPNKPAPATQQGIAPAPNGLFDDLPPTSAQAADISALELDLSPSSTPQLELDRGPELDLSPSSTAPAPSSSFGDLDLSEPTSKPVISIKTPSKPSAPMQLGGAVDKSATAKAPQSLELEVEGAATPAAPVKQPAKKPLAPEVSRDHQKAKQKRAKLVAGIVLGLAAAGGGGFYFYQRHAKAQERAEQVGTGIQTARGALVAVDPNHWARAASAAQNVLEVESDNAPALAIAAEAMLAGALDTGINGPARIAGARKKIADAIAAGGAGPELGHAQALAAIAGGQPDAAIAKLQALLAGDPKNSFLNLYLGWAQLAKGDGKAAVAAFELATASPATKVAALYGRGRAKLIVPDPAGARSDFTGVLGVDKDHIGAQVGLAETLPPSQGSQREADLLAILARKDIDKADPRAVVAAWSLAADVARLGGRLDVARERYHKALAITQLDATALIGLAAVELRDGRLAVAADLIQKALAQSPNDPAAKLEQAELDIRQGKLPDATALLKELANRVPPLPPLQHAQLQVVQGKLLEAQGADDDAVDAYEQGAKDAGDLDLAPTMAAVEKLGQLAKKASDARDDKKAAGYHERADQLLSSLAERARDDAQLSLTLGAAYLQAGDAAKAESFLRRAVEMRTNDIEAKLELAKALARLDRADDAIEQLKAALAADPARADIALELARTYEHGGRDDAARKAYDALTAKDDATVAARAYAGRYLARKGEIKKAAEQGDAILRAEPENAAGHYLKGEGQLALGVAHLDDARKELGLAVEADPDPQYLDAQGRVAEAIAATGETKYLDLALRAYTRATDGDPKLFNAWAGQGRVHVARKEWDLAAKPLETANKLADSKDAAVMFDLGLCAEKLGQKPVAIAWFVKSSLIKPSAEASHHLGQLYVDVNNAKFAVQAYEAATRLAAEQEKQTGKQVEWLTEDFYQLGNLAYGENNFAIAKAAWEHYLARNPAAGVRVNEAKHHLSTDLR